MKVLLFNPWLPLHERTNASFGAVWPLGLLYLAAATQASGHRAVIFDAAIGGRVSWVLEDKLCIEYVVNPIDGVSLQLVGTTPDMLMGVIKRVCPKVLGISLLLSSQHCLVVPLVKAVKKLDMDITIVLGGTHATMASDMLIEIEGVDYVVTGEGERAFPALLNKLEAGEEPKGIPGVHYKGGENKPFDLILDVDALPLPAYDLVPKYPYYHALNSAMYQIFSSRGCPNNCRFCSAPFLTRRHWRPHSIERVLGEIGLLLSRGADEIRFADDNVAVDKNRFKAILEGVIKNREKVLLSACSMHCQTLDKEMLLMMNLAGFERVMFAPESGNDRVIKEEIGKTFTVADAENMVRDITNAGLIPDLNILIGMPGETWAEIQDTIEFCKRMKAISPGCGAWVSCATPMLKTELYDEAVEKGLYAGGIPPLFSYAVATYDGIDWTKEQLEETRKMLMLGMNGHI